MKLENKLKLIMMLLRINGAKSVKKIFKEWIIITVIASILITFIMLLRYTQHIMTVSYAESKFDLIVQGYTGEQISEIQQLKYIEKVFPVRLLYGEAGKGDQKLAIDIYAADSFENKNISFFSDKMFIQSDKEILLNNKLNPIVIDEKMAQKFNVGVGDKVSLFFGSNKVDVSFTVAAICESMEKTLGMPPVLILWQGEQQEAFFKSFNENPPYGYMFIKAKNKDLAKDYFLKKYIPLQFVKEGHLNIEDKEKILHYNSSLLIDRESHLEELLYELRYTPPIVMLASVLGFITYVLILYRETNKRISMKEKEYSILHALGLHKFNFLLLSMVETLILQIPVIIISSFIVKYVIYDSLFNAFLPWYLFIWYCLGALILQICAVLINGIFLYFKMLRTSTAAQLAKE